MSQNPKLNDDFSDIDNLERATESFMQEQHKLLAAKRPVRAPKQRGVQKAGARSGKSASAETKSDVSKEARRKKKIERQVSRDRMRLQKVAERQEEQAARKAVRPRLSGAWIGGIAGVTLAAVLVMTSLAVFSGRHNAADDLIRTPQQTTAAIAEQTVQNVQTGLTETAPAVTAEISGTVQSSALPKPKQSTALSTAAARSSAATSASLDPQDARTAGGTNSAVPSQPVAQYYAPADPEDDVQYYHEDDESGTQRYTSHGTSAAPKITTSRRSASATTQKVTSASTRKSATTTTTTTTTTTSRPTTASTTRKSTTTTTTTTTTAPPPEPSIDLISFEVLDWELVDEEQNIYTQRVRVHLYNDSPTALNHNLILPLVCENAESVQHIRCLSGNVETAKGVSISENTVFLPFTAYMKGWTYQVVELEITTVDYINDFWIDYDAE